MSFLAPLYALGLLAVAAPVVLHLIRRRPKGEVPFSSLMFLTPSPPPPASRRRLDQLLLLLLRATALVLLGLAFMRPYLRQDAAAGAGEPGLRVVLLIDTSASLRRGDLWARAAAAADAALADCRPADRVAVYAFDRTARPVLTFAESDRLDLHQRVAVARDRVRQLTPTWGRTELGRVLVDGAGAILEASAGGPAARGKVVLVSDLQRGARLAELSGFEWPAEVELDLRTVTDDGGNAGLALLADRPDNNDKGGRPAGLRVRVSNEPGAKQERFRLGWSGAGAEVEAYVPPGESRVVQVPRPPAGAPAPTLRLHGDTHEFDNTAHVAPPRRQDLTVFYLGAGQAADPAGLLYFLERTWDETPERSVRVVARLPADGLTAAEVRGAPLVVLAGAPSPEAAGVLDQYVRDGGTVLAVLAAAGPLPALAGASAQVAEDAKVDGYVMLRDVTFDHPLFAPLSGPQFGDFTRVHFWKHRRVTDQHLPGARVLARFDGGDPAVLEKTWGRGRLVVFTSGWQTADGQLARSSKFVPLMTALLELRDGGRPAATHYLIGDRIPVPSASAAVRKPDGTTTPLAPDATAFEGTDQPGVYVFDTPSGPQPIAVNLDPAESLTAPLPVETLEQFGCRLVKRGGDEPRAEAERQQRNAELERSQSIWRGLILAAIAVLLVETGLAGWRSRPAGREGVTP